jgi:hypothetical protein
MPGVVRGARELNLAFSRAGVEFTKTKRARFRWLAEPVREDAQRLALGNQVGASWSAMRTGATETVAYVAPVNRGTRIRYRKRRNFASFLYRVAFAPAREHNRSAVAARYDELVARLERFWKRG